LQLKLSQFEVNLKQLV